MTNGAMLFILFVAVFFSICIPAGVGAYWCWVNRKVEGHTSEILKRWAFLLFAISYDCASKLIANGVGFIGARPVYSLGYAIAFWQGQIVLACAMIYLISYFIGNKKELDKK